ncbi:hypothetical protein L1887_57052 [Cichorium endivia]|nr:hypothetical protein L1887_57052 [Cichorium endivia]
MSREEHPNASDRYELIASACFWIGDGEERRRLRAARFQPADMASPNIVAIEASTEPRHEGLGLRSWRCAALLIRHRAAQPRQKTPSELQLLHSAEASKAATPSSLAMFTRPCVAAER